MPTCRVVDTSEAGRTADVGGDDEERGSADDDGREGECEKGDDGEHSQGLLGDGVERLVDVTDGDGRHEAKDVPLGRPIPATVGSGNTNDGALKLRRQFLYIFSFNITFL